MNSDENHASRDMDECFNDAMRTYHGRILECGPNPDTYDESCRKTALDMTTTFKICALKYSLDLMGAGHAARESYRDQRI